MYRTSELRLTRAAGKIPELSSEKIDQLSKEQRVEIGSRIEILQTLAGYKWVGEASHAVSTVKPSEPTKEQKVAMALLDDMELANYFDWIERTGRYYSWVQFAINKPMLDMFKNEKYPFSVIEEGAVYGYLVSSTLAFAGVIPAKRVSRKSVANYYLSGVNSEKYYERETEYAEKVWHELSKISPKLTAEANEKYRHLPAQS